MFHNPKEMHMPDPNSGSAPQPGSLVSGAGNEDNDSYAKGFGSAPAGQVIEEREEANLAEYEASVPDPEPSEDEAETPEGVDETDPVTDTEPTTEGEGASTEASDVADSGPVDTGVLGDDASGDAGDGDSQPEEPQPAGDGEEDAQADEQDGNSRVAPANPTEGDGDDEEDGAQ